MHLYLTWLPGDLTWQEILLYYTHTLLLLISQKVFKVLVGLLLLLWWSLRQRTSLTSRIRWRRLRIWRRRRLLLLAGHRNRPRLGDDGWLLKLLVKHRLTTHSYQLLLLLLLNRSRLVRVSNGLNDSISLDLLNDPLLLLLLLTGHHVGLNHSTWVAHFELLDSGWIHQTSPYGHGHIVIRSYNSNGTFLGEQLRSYSHRFTHSGCLLYLLLHLLLYLLQVSRRQHIWPYGLHLTGKQLLLQLLLRLALN